MSDKQAVITYLDEVLHDHEDMAVARVGTDMLVDTIILLKASCGTCHWFYDDHCVCAASWHCTDPRLAKQLCECWEVRK